MCPGTIHTKMYETVLNDPELIKRNHQNIPLGRVAKVEEVAAVALHLASDESSYVTGTAVMVDDGRSVT